MCIIVVRSVFEIKKTIIIHKFIYMNVCMTMNINMKVILIPLYKCNFCTIYYFSFFRDKISILINYIELLLFISYIELILSIALFHQAKFFNIKAFFIHQLHKASFIYCFVSSDKISKFIPLINGKYQTNKH